MSNENAVRNLIRVDDKANPTLFRALQLLIDDLYNINNAVFPIDDSGTIDQGNVGGGGLLGAVQNFTGVAYPDNLRLDWDVLLGAFSYQIKIGNNWDTAKPVVITSSDVANIDPLYLRLTYGTYVFLIRGLSIGGVLGDLASCILIIPTIPPPNLDVEVVVSTVLLRWTEPASAWRIDYYNVYKDNIKVGSITGTFKLIQELVGGTYSYSVEAVDIVGNVSTRSPIKTVDLHDPSEYAFVTDRFASLNGTYVRTEKARIDNIQGIFGPLVPRTWEEHYQFFGFDSPQEQVDAGYPVYYQPSYIGDGTYQETFDFGQIYKNLTVVIDYNKLQLAGFTDLTTELSASEDNITYTPVVFGISMLAVSFRYIKVKWTFTNLEDLSAAFISSLRVILNVTLTIDSGAKQCLAADVGGTVVTYNKEFTGISSVTATPATSSQPLYAVTRDVNKDNFKILIFDSSGNRANSMVDWKVRGVI